MVRVIEDGDYDGLTSYHITSHGWRCYESADPSTFGYKRRHSEAAELPETNIIYSAASVFIFLDLETRTPS